MQSLYIIDFLFGVDKGTHLGDMIPEGIVGQGILWQMTCSKTFSALWAPEQSSNYPVENVYYSYRKSVQYLLMLCNLFSNFLWVLVILHHTNYSYSIVYSIIYFLSKQNIFSWKVVFRRNKISSPLPTCLLTDHMRRKHSQVPGAVRWKAVYIILREEGVTWGQ